MSEYLLDYQYHAAGRLWRVPRLKVDTLPDGTQGIPMAEFNRVHRAIVNEVCGNEDLLSVAELDFLCDVTSTTYSELAIELELHKSALSRWHREGTIPHRLYSTAIKRFFWFKVFGPDIGSSTVEIALSKFRTEIDFLRFAHDHAISCDYAEPMQRVAA